MKKNFIKFKQQAYCNQTKRFMKIKILLLNKRNFWKVNFPVLVTITVLVNKSLLSQKILNYLLKILLLTLMRKNYEAKV